MLARWGAIFLVPFFCVHFGGFMLGHFLFLWQMFGGGWNENVADHAKNSCDPFR